MLKLCNWTLRNCKRSCREIKAFWVDADKTGKAVYVSKDTDERRQCWECGCPFTWADANNNDGDWNEGYCGC